MESKLTGRRVAILATNGFEQSELEKPLEVLKDNGATVDIISLQRGKIKGWKDHNWGNEVEVNISIEEANVNEYDALVLPGGVMNPDQLRISRHVVAFVKAFMERDRPIAAICHGPWTLIETKNLQGKKMTSYKSLRTDLINAGVEWVNEEVVVDKGLITSRDPKDLPAFCEKLVEEISEIDIVDKGISEDFRDFFLQ
ncbi:MAG TPA: type 1 glutamine amidotransferase domain-containing protein [Bacteroidia bacterium]|nr:type 1 glutamine amidotransferase domain-containing protein [Bacteroidia bacterium]